MCDCCGVSARHLNVFLTCLLLLDTTHSYECVLCIIVFVDCTMYTGVVHYKISAHTIACCYC